MAFLPCTPLIRSRSSLSPPCVLSRAPQMCAAARLARVRPAPGHEFSRPSSTSLSSSGPLTSCQVDFFFSQGYVIVKNLLPTSSLDALVAASLLADDHERGFSSRIYDRVNFRLCAAAEVFKNIATDSPVSDAVAQLLPLGPVPGRERVVVNDAFFRMKKGDSGCDFHVDDPHFWPCPQGEPGPGINAWIALGKVKKGCGGGLVVAPGSFTDEYLDCREAIQQRQTCLMGKLAPKLRERLERIKVTPEFEVGDVIFCTRWLFHRGDPFVVGGEEGIGRYTIRYMPGDAVVIEKGVDNVDGEIKFFTRDPVVLSEADPETFPAVVLN